MRFSDAGTAAVLLAIALLSGAVASCGDAVGPRLERVQAEARWSSARVGTYSWLVSHYCGECGEGAGRVARVSVREGQVESRIFVDRGGETSVPDAVAELYPAVETLFAAIRAAQADPTVDVIAEYDAELGYPTRIDITVSDPRVVDGVVGWVIGDFSTN